MSKIEIILSIVSIISLSLTLVMYKRQNPKEPSIRYVDTSIIKTNDRK